MSTNKECVELDSKLTSVKLSELQAQFKRYMMSYEGPITQHVTSTAILSNEFRLAIYANAYRSRLVETLQKDFPALNYLMGEDDFGQLAVKYIDAYPSRHTSLRWFGQYFDHFIRSQTDYSFSQFFAELATLEWKLVDAFNAEDVEVCGESDVATVPSQAWPNLVFEFHPSVHVFKYQWNIIPVWQSEQNQQTPPQPDRLAREQICVVWRQQLTTRYRTLEQDEALVLEDMKNGANFTHMCEQLSNVVEPDEVALRAAGLLKSWLVAGLITKIRWE